jgi:hypothetical protein
MPIIARIIAGNLPAQALLSCHIDTEKPHDRAGSLDYELLLVQCGTSPKPLPTRAERCPKSRCHHKYSQTTRDALVDAHILLKSLHALTKS